MSNLPTQLLSWAFARASVMLAVVWVGRKTAVQQIALQMVPVIDLGCPGKTAPENARATADDPEKVQKTVRPSGFEIVREAGRAAARWAGTALAAEKLGGTRGQGRLAAGRQVPPLGSGRADGRPAILVFGARW